MLDLPKQSGYPSRVTRSTAGQIRCDDLTCSGIDSMQPYFAAGIIVAFLVVLSLPLFIFVRSALSMRKLLKQAAEEHGLRFRDSAHELAILAAGDADWYAHVPQKNLLFSNIVEGTLEGAEICFADVGVGGHHRGAPEGRMCFYLVSQRPLPELTITSPRKTSIPILRRSETAGRILIEPHVGVNYDASVWTEGQVRSLLDFDLPESFRNEPSFRAYTQGRFLIVKDERRKIAPAQWVCDSVKLCTELGRALTGKG
jgi:hypothetical protein